MSTRTFTFSYALPTRSSIERYESDFFIWLNLLVKPLVSPPRMDVVFSAVLFSADSVFWNTWLSRTFFKLWFMSSEISRQTVMPSFRFNSLAWRTFDVSTVRSVVISSSTRANSYVGRKRNIRVSVSCIQISLRFPLSQTHTWLHSARTRSCSSLDRPANSFAISTELIDAAPGELSDNFSDPSVKYEKKTNRWKWQDTYRSYVALHMCVFCCQCSNSINRRGDHQLST